jgi:hypothetical protein
MKKTLLIFFILGFLLFFSYSTIFAQDTQDPGIPDTIRFLPWGTYVVCPPCTGRAVVPMVVVNDEYLWSMTIPLKWIGPISIDTAIFVGDRADFMSQKYFSPDTAQKKVLLFAAVLGGEELIPPGQGILIYLYFTVQDTGSVTVDTCVPPLSFFHFLDQDLNTIIPYFSPSEFHILEPSTLPGDLNQDGSITVSDVVYFINYLFKGGSPPGYLPSADTNTDCEIDVSDLIYFINYLFKSGSPPWMGCCYTN